jgi:NAD(P)H dehydrogenase (quinone)
MIVVTGASGQLGRLVIKALLQSVQPSEVVAAVRSPDKVSDLADLGVEVRPMDYTKPETIDTALAGAQKVLLISSNEVGIRVPQHANVIDGCKKAGVQLLAYTSILHADSSPLPLAQEHKETEVLLAQSGVPFVLLRNGWYSENYTASVPVALEHGAVLGCAGDGKISSAARADYALAAAKVLLSEGQAGKVYELAGDSAYTLDELAAEIARQSGKEIVYQNLPEEAYFDVLKSAGLHDKQGSGNTFNILLPAQSLAQHPRIPTKSDLSHCLPGLLT